MAILGESFWVNQDDGNMRLEVFKVSIAGEDLIATAMRYSTN